MPELPEVETSCNGIRPHIVERKVSAVEVRTSKLRWPVPDTLEFELVGRTLQAVNRRAKYLLLTFEHGTLVIHLGMSGSLRILKAEEPPGKHDHVDIVFNDDDQRVILRYHDPRKFGAVLWEEDIQSSPLIQHLGPEPLTDAFNAAYLHQQAQKRTVAVKQFIMDNKVVVGVGNIYANEALFMAGLRPTLAANSISKARFQRLVEAIKTVLANAIAQGGTTLKDFVGGDGKPGYFQQTLSVYGRAGLPCTSCATELKEIRMQGRSSVYCPKCQKGR
jgi:formamidopyrimidine-DNA glycosylase